MTLAHFYILLAFLAVAAIEGVIISSRGTYDWKSFFFSIGDLLLKESLVLLLPLWLYYNHMDFFVHRSVFKIPVVEPWHWVCLFVAVDFCYYWRHRLLHVVPIMWAGHAPHHSSTDFSFASGYRHGIIGSLSRPMLFYIPLFLLGVEAGPLFLVIAIHNVAQVWTHAGSWFPRLGWLEYILVTPRSHRTHHERGPEDSGSNFGGLLCVFDRMFGTFREGALNAPCGFSPDSPLRTSSFLPMETDSYRHLFMKIWQAPTIRGKAGALFFSGRRAEKKAGRPAAENPGAHSSPVLKRDFPFPSTGL